ncbi:MAG TPA: HAD family hydrolase [Candidatus Limnocylindrales bacterium]|nr:HAD family hydrolase [Candidatus Limnocylindrales bacterium]
MSSPLAGVRAISLDFGNTLVPVDRAGLSRVVDVTASAVVERSGPFSVEAFLAAWAEERERQFRDEVPRFREVDLRQRMVRVLARLRGMTAPPTDLAWDDVAAAARSSADELDFAVEAYSRAFVAGLPPMPSVTPLLERLSRAHILVVLSNWPLAATIDRYVEASGWMPFFRAIVVSQRVGTIKPHPSIFRAAEEAMGLGAADRPTILHVGDDWAADVVGAKRAGWRAAYLRRRPDDSPLPSSARDGEVEPDLELDSLDQLVEALAS